MNVIPTYIFSKAAHHTRKWCMMLNIHAPFIGNIYRFNVQKQAFLSAINDSICF